MSLKSAIAKCGWSILDPLLRKVGNRIDYLASQSPASLQNPVIHGTQLGESATIYPTTRLLNLSKNGITIRIGAHTQVHGEVITYWNAGNVRIGDWCFVGPSSRIWSQSSVTIGNHVLISHLVDIHDSDGHPLSWEERRNDVRAIFQGGYRVPTQTESKPVTIEDDAWICLKATVLKGVTVGRGSIVAAGAVVTQDVPPFTIVAGNPAKVIKELPQSFLK